MARDVIVPEVGEKGMDVTFVRWLKAAGDQVAVGDPLFEVDTEKSVMVVEAYVAGTLADLRASEGDLIAPRDVIGRILASGESADDQNDAPGDASGTAGDRPAGPVTRATAAATLASGEPTQPAGRGRRGVSPRARRVAADLGVDVDGVAGSGPDGLVTESDVRAAARRVDGPDAAPAVGSYAPALEPVAPALAPSAFAPDAIARVRKAVADLTTSSWQTIPHFYLQLEAEVDRGLELARPTPLVCAAVARALVRHPECNLAWDGDATVPRETVDLGLLVDTPSGLLIAVIDDAHELDLAGMAGAIRAAVGRARDGRLAAADRGPRSLTVSNLGMFRVDRFAAVIPRPDMLALAVGRARVQPRWDGGTFVPRRVLGLTLSVDHRALDGAAAARFLGSLEAILADPKAEGLA